MTGMADKFVYFDTTYLVRLYLEDSGFKPVRQRSAESIGVVCGWHGQVEFVAALHRAFREQRIERQQLVAIIIQFRADCREGQFQWLELNESVRERVELVFKNAPATSFLRAADALHLACAAEHGFEEVYSNDRHFLLAAPLFGLRGINVIS
jgi:predicted nucleic acid-binding protein